MRDYKINGYSGILISFSNYQKNCDVDFSTRISKVISFFLLPAELCLTSSGQQNFYYRNSQERLWAGSFVTSETTTKICVNHWLSSTCSPARPAGVVLFQVPDRRADLTQLPLARAESWDYTSLPAQTLSYSSAFITASPEFGKQQALSVNLPKESRK